MVKVTVKQEIPKPPPKEITIVVSEGAALLIHHLVGVVGMNQMGLGIHAQPLYSQLEQVLCGVTHIGRGDNSTVNLPDLPKKYKYLLD